MFFRYVPDTKNTHLKKKSQKLCTFWLCNADKAYIGMTVYNIFVWYIVSISEALFNVACRFYTMDVSDRN